MTRYYYSLPVVVRAIGCIEAEDGLSEDEVFDLVQRNHCGFTVKITGENPGGLEAEQIEMYKALIKGNVIRAFFSEFCIDHTEVDEEEE